MKAAVYNRTTGRVVAVYDDCPETGPTCPLDASLAWVGLPEDGLSAKTRIDVSKAVPGSKLESADVVSKTIAERRLLVSASVAKAKFNDKITVAIETTDGESLIASTETVRIVAQCGNTELVDVEKALVGGQASVEVTAPSEFPAEKGRVIQRVISVSVTSAESDCYGAKASIYIDEHLPGITP